MRGDSVRDLYAKLLVLSGLALLAGFGALVDYWPADLGVPSIANLRVRPMSLGTERVIAVPDSLTFAAVPRPQRSRPVNVVPAPVAGDVTEPIVEPDPSATIDTVPEPPPPVPLAVLPVEPAALFAPAVEISAPAVSTLAFDRHLTSMTLPTVRTAAPSSDGLLKRTGATLATAGAMTGAVVGGAFTTVGGAVTGAVKGVFGKMMGLF
jgi:hypothetical protein